MYPNISNQNQEAPKGPAPPYSRDPNDISEHVQVMFDDIIGEPRGLAMPGIAWNCNKIIYEKTMYYIYVALAVVFGPILAILNAILFGFEAFIQIWILGPCLRYFRINMAFIRKVNIACLWACYGPCIQVASALFSNIRVRYQRGSEDPKNTNIEELIFNV